jgi:hypothetical protein
MSTTNPASTTDSMDRSMSSIGGGCSSERATVEAARHWPRDLDRPTITIGGSHPDDERERRMVGRGSSAPSAAWTTAEVSTLAAVGGLVGGLLIGASGPVFFVAFTPFIVGGLTAGGWALLVSVCAAAVSGLAALAVRRGRYATMPIFAATAVLAAGIVAGTQVGPAIGVGYRPPASTPRPTMSFGPPPVFLEAPATVTVRLTGVPGFVATRSAPYDGGLFGHWCRSKPDSTELGGFDVHEVGRLNGRPLHASVTLEGIDLPPVWIVLQVEATGAGPDPVWVGEGRLAASTASGGRVTFSGLAADQETVAGWPSTLSGDMAWTCTAWDQR